MSPRRTRPVVWLLIAGLTLALLGLWAAPAPALAQDATPAATAAVEAPAGTPETPATPGTPTLSPTPTETPTPTPTFTERQARLALAQAYLKGGDYAAAAEIFAAIALEDRGNAEALAGLDAALAAQAAAAATAAAPPPTLAPTATPRPAPGVTFGSTFSKQLTDFTGTALAGLLLILLVYVFAQLLRWAWINGREAWWTRGVAWLRGKAVKPSYVIGTFADASETGVTDFPGPKIVAQALTEQLVGLNEGVQPELQVPVKPEGLELGGMAWIKLLWDWILPPPWAYKVEGVLLGNKGDGYKLAVARIAMAHNRIDASRTFEPAYGAGQSAGLIFRELAATAALWLRDPIGVGATTAAARGMVAARGVGEEAAAGVALSPTEIVNEVLAILVPLRQQIAGGIRDQEFVTARQRLAEAATLLRGLPEASALRQDLQSSIDDLRGRVQPGAA